MDRGRFAITVCPRGAGVWLFRAFLLLICVSAPAGLCAAEDDDLFQVLGIHVDETDQTAAAARTKALTTGERRAWEILVERLVDPAQRARMASIPQIGDAVKDFWVTDEKTSPVRYIATLNYNFSPTAVRRLLAARGARFSTTRSKPMLVMPVFIPGGDTQSGEGLAAAWREAWSGVVRQKGLVPMRLAAGDPADTASVLIEPASVLDRGRLAELARRNDVDDVLVSVATVVSPGDAPVWLLKTSSTRYPSSGAPQPLPDKTYPLTAPENEAAVLAEAAAAVAQDVQNSWRRSSVVSLKPVSRITVRVQTLTLQDWVEMRRRLLELPQAKGVEILSVGREYAIVQISYPGGPEDLVTALARRGLAMRNDNGNWLVSDASALPPAEDIGEPFTAQEEEPAR
jgi:hypothetical protein